MTTPPGASYRSRIIVSQKIIPVLGLSLPLFVFWIFANYSDTALPLDDLTLLADRLNRRSDFHGKPSFPLFGQKCPNNILANPSCFCKNYFYFFLPKTGWYAGGEGALCLSPGTKAGGTKPPCLICPIRLSAFRPALLISPDDPALGQVVGGELDGHLIPRKDTDKVHPQLTADMCQHLVPILQLHLQQLKPFDHAL